MAVANILTIAGSDSGGGAGIQADLKSISAQGAYGASVITAVTAQNTRSVTSVHAVPPSVVRAQIDAVLSDIRIDAIKIGMLGMPDVIHTVAAALADFKGPVVLDPVMVAKSGVKLLPEEAVTSMRDHLFPLASILTPNLLEAGVLLGRGPADCDETALDQAQGLLELGPAAVLLKGGHAQGDICTDLLLTGSHVHRFSSRRIETRNTHGTGCSYAAAIAALSGQGHDIVTAVQEAHHWLQGAILNADRLSVGHGHGPVHHFHKVWK